MAKINSNGSIRTGRIRTCTMKKGSLLFYPVV
nr:MAG TPA: hypothetical protein [Caudoviricetes sp.]DAM37645.1 MAG TPA: hypothetical protein [Caudoviricetes sp.]DAS05076.1 MAG TPA: hypothetical protein [Caudoviricetes sp.]